MAQEQYDSEFEDQSGLVEEAYRNGFYLAASFVNYCDKPNEKMVLQSRQHHEKCRAGLFKRFGKYPLDGNGCIHEELANYRGFRDGMESAFNLWWMLTDLGRSEYNIFIFEWTNDVRRWKSDTTIEHPSPPLVDNWEYIRGIAEFWNMKDVDSLLVKPKYGVIRVGTGRNVRMLYVGTIGRYNEQPREASS